MRARPSHPLVAALRRLLARWRRRPPVRRTLPSDPWVKARVWRELDPDELAELPRAPRTRPSRDLEVPDDWLFPKRRF